MNDVSIGVEEEFHLLDAATGELRPDVAGVLRQVPAERDTPAEPRIEPELLRTQIETGTPVCRTLAELAAELTRTRRALAGSARDAGCRIAAGGTWPGQAAPVAATAKPRYEDIVERFGPTAREATVCGCHVHVGLADPELVVAVIRRSRPWLPVLLALSANSPFWRGADTGYASYRSQVWARWPTAASPPALHSRAEYDRLVAQLLGTGVMRDEGMLYWEVRASQTYPTVEFRVADVCLTVGEAVVLAGLTRALVRSCVAEETAGRPVADVRPELLRAASWRAARSGLGGDLVDPQTWTPVPADVLVSRLLDHLGPELEAEGDADFVAHGVRRMLREGTGAHRQRAAYAARHRIVDVVDLLVSAAESGE